MMHLPHLFRIKSIFLLSLIMQWKIELLLKSSISFVCSVEMNVFQGLKNPRLCVFVQSGNIRFSRLEC